MITSIAIIVLGLLGLVYGAVIFYPALKSKNEIVHLWGCVALSNGLLFACFMCAGIIRLAQLHFLWPYYGMLSCVVMLWGLYSLYRLNEALHDG